MALTEGSILPICYDFWPQTCSTVVLGFIKEIHGDMYTICPVHNELEKADFYDLIVPANENSLRCNLVIKGKLCLRFWKNAFKDADVIEARAGNRNEPKRKLLKVRAGQNVVLHRSVEIAPDGRQGIIPPPPVPADGKMEYRAQSAAYLADSERAAILRNLDYVLENDKTASAFRGPLRGKLTGSATKVGRELSRFEKHWQMFHLNSLCAAIKENLHRFPEDFHLEFLLENINDDIKNGNFSMHVDNDLFKQLGARLKKILDSKALAADKYLALMNTKNGLLELVMTVARC